MTKNMVGTATRVVGERDLSIDAARGVALFLVVLSHTCQVPHCFCDFFIIAFFFLSGYLYKPGKSYGCNVKKKAKRVLIPYFANSLALLAISALIDSYSAKTLKLAVFGVLYSRFSMGNLVLMFSHNAPLWYLTAFFATSLLFHVVVDYFSNTWERTALLFVMFETATIALFSVPILLPWSLDMAPLFCTAMMVGYLFKKHGINFDFGWGVTAVILVGYMALCYSTGRINLSIRDLGNDASGGLNVLALGVCGTVACVSLCKERCFRPFERFFVSIGTNTIVVLCYHLIFFDLGKFLYGIALGTYVGGSFNSTFLFSFIIAILSVFCCLALGYIVDFVKNKFNQYVQ